MHGMHMHMHMLTCTYTCTHSAHTHCTCTCETCTRLETSPPRLHPPPLSLLLIGHRVCDT